MDKRRVIVVDEQKCTGCGLCIPSCAKGIFKVVDGKAKLTNTYLCDGLMKCLGKCPQGAISTKEV